MQYDLIGDVHGHFDLLERLVEKLGYTRTRRGYEHREDRKLVFVGDLINRGPDSLSVLKTVKETWEEGNSQECETARTRPHRRVEGLGSENQRAT